MWHLEHLGDCQNSGPFLGPYYNTGPNTGPNLGDPKRDHNFDNRPLTIFEVAMSVTIMLGVSGKPTPLPSLPIKASFWSSEHAEACEANE